MRLAAGTAPRRYAGAALRRTALPLAVGAVVTLLAPGSAVAALSVPLPLPLPLAADAQSTELCGAVGSRSDRCLVSVVPGPVRNDEVVLVGLDGSGAPAVVEVEQRLLLRGEGDYAVRERGPARQARTLGDLDPPVTKFGAVVWQGFSPGERELAALLTLDAGLERDRLPLVVTTTFTPSGGQPQALGPGGAVPGPGTVSVRLTNRTGQPGELPTAADAPAGVLAPLLDTLLARAVKDRTRLERSMSATGSDTPGSVPIGTRLPAAGAGLPRAVDVTGPARVQDEVSTPLNLAARLTATGATVTPASPGAEAVPGGAQLVGTLPGGQSVELAVTLDGAGTVALGATAVPAVDPRTLAPPDGAGSWRAWAAAGPSAASRRTALDLLVRSAAAGARAASYSPYLGADLPGTGSTVFRFAFAPPEQLPEAAEQLTPRRGAIALTVLALLLLLAHASLWWARS